MCDLEIAKKTLIVDINLPSTWQYSLIKNKFLIKLYCHVTFHVSMLLSVNVVIVP